MKTKPLIMITGASSGIGKACAKLFSNNGYPLLLISRRLEPMKALQLPNTLCISTDVKDFSALLAAIDEAQKVYGYIDCLINNAGIITTGDFTSMDIETDHEIIDINFKGVVNAAKAVLPTMRENKHGTILNVSSIGDRIYGLKNSATYCASKAAIKSFTQSLVLSNGCYNIRCCNIAPGYIETPIWDNVKKPSFEGMDIQLVSAKKMAEVIYWIYSQPQEINIRDIVLTPTGAPI